MPPILVGIARASGYRWAATKVAGIYFVLWLLALWLVALVPAQAKVGAGYTPLSPLGSFGVSRIFVCRGRRAGFFAGSHGRAQQVDASRGRGRRLFSCDDGSGVA